MSHPAFVASTSHSILLSNKWILDCGRLEIEGTASVWLRDQKVRLRHVNTNSYLHSHDKKYNRIVTGHQEVCGVTKKSSDNIWSAAEGVYFPAKSTA
jgi:dolichyl-phosphate-mannose--protein O-mannosyl transferase